jgi:hypothetical protein
MIWQGKGLFFRLASASLSKPKKHLATVGYAQQAITTKLSNYQIIKLPNFQISKLADYQISTLAN